MNLIKYYRLISKKRGIYEAEDKDCPKGNVKRETKPDGSWLKKVGTQFPGAISFWTKKGCKKYSSSGLLQWHCSVVKKPLEVIIIKKPKEILYKDQ